jgi:hypothetical protein
MGVQIMQRRPPIKPDPEYSTGGWKVHLTIGPDLYEQRVSAVKLWLKQNVEGTCPRDWKYRTGGDRHEKDFTVYLGSYATMIAFVNALENDPIVHQLDTPKTASDRIVGKSGKVGARFDPYGRGKGWRGDWTYGWNGIPFQVKDKILAMEGTRTGNKTSWQDAAKRSSPVLKAMYGDYFLPEGID